SVSNDIELRKQEKKRIKQLKHLMATFSSVNKKRSYDEIKERNPDDSRVFLKPGYNCPHAFKAFKASQPETIHLSIDCIVGKSHKGKILTITLVNTGYRLAIPIRSTNDVASEIFDVISSYVSILRRSSDRPIAITMDQGREFTKIFNLENLDVDLRVFCSYAGCPQNNAWAENTNKTFRDYGYGNDLPLVGISPQYARTVNYIVNNIDTSKGVGNALTNTMLLLNLDSYEQLPLYNEYVAEDIPKFFIFPRSNTNKLCRDITFKLFKHGAKALHSKELIKDEQLNQLYDLIPFEFIKELITDRCL
ncbi:hypothetical protein CKF54_07200, partial [Psittacicella hinzii]